MSDWREATDPNTGRKYYYNKATRETLWKPPPGYVSPNAAGQPAASSAAAAPTSTPAAATTAATAAPTAAAPAPAAVPAAAAVAASKPAAGAPATAEKKSDWIASYDTKNNRVYYYNKITRETRWDKPAELEESEKKDEKVQEHKHFLREEDAQAKGTMELRMDDLRKALEEDDVDEKVNDDGDVVRRKHVEANANHEFEFNQHKRGLMGPVLSTEEMLSFQKDTIRTSIFKLESSMASQAVQCFRNITGYMGDRNSSKEPIPHARKLLRYGLGAPEELRDEIYLQLCKQTNNNPNALSNTKGWELMALCTGTFPPSENFESFLFAYFEKNSASAGLQQDTHIQQLAAYCKDRAERILTTGSRTEVPSSHEIECVKNMDLVPVRISLLNGTVKTFNVDCFTLMGDVVRRMHKKLGLTFTLPFSIFEVAETEDERIPDPEERILDVIASWDRIAAENKKNKNRQLKLPTKFALIFKAMLCLKTTEPQLTADEQAVSLIYYQAVHDVITGRYPTTDKDITTLGAIQLQSQLGDYHPDIHSPEFLADKLGEFIPAVVYETLKKPEKKREYCRKLLAKYAKLQGYSALEAKLHYLDYTQQWPIYGCQFFPCQTGGMQFRDYPNPLLVGINMDGMMLVHPETRVVLERWTYGEVVTWGSSDDKFITVVGNLVQQKKLFFRTDRGKDMNYLVQQYVKFKLGEQGAKRLADKMVSHMRA